MGYNSTQQVEDPKAITDPHNYDCRGGNEREEGWVRKTHIC